MPQSGLNWASEPAWGAESKIGGIRVAKVVGVNWEDHTVDLIDEGGAALLHVPLSAPWAGTDYGEFRMPQFAPVRPGAAIVESDDGTGLPGGTRDTFALVAFVHQAQLSPVVLGFIFPEVSQMMMPGMQRITRHVGGTYTGVSEDGDVYLAYSPDGSYISFHNDSPTPPIVYGVDYDRLADPSADAGKFHSLSIMLRNGASFHLDGDTGNFALNAGPFGQIEAHDQLDLFGRVITLSGLPAIYPGGITATTVAPSTADATVPVLHLCTNAAWEYVGPIASRAPGSPPTRPGWTFLAPGNASRMELPPNARPRFWKSVNPGAAVGETIDWIEVPLSGGGGAITVTEEGGTPELTPITKLIFPDDTVEVDGGDAEAAHIKRWKYLIPPEQPDTVSWSTSGNYSQPWLCGPTPDGPITFTDHTLVSGASGTLVLRLNGSGVPLPTTGDPLEVEEGDIVTFDLTGITALGVIWMLTIWGRREYEDTTNFRVVDLEAGPPPTVVDQ